MNHDISFSLEPPSQYQFVHEDRSSPSPDSILDTLLHEKSRIFASKLEVLVHAMLVRIELMRENVSRVDTDKEHAEAMLAGIERQARYHVRDHREKTVFYQTLCRLEEERRSQAVECWRDIVMVLRDFLGVWEAHQQSQARALFLQHVGS